MASRSSRLSCSRSRTLPGSRLSRRNTDSSADGKPLLATELPAGRGHTAGDHPGSGSEATSASTASRSARERRRHVSMETAASARRHVPAMTPSTSRAPGQTRDVHRRARCAAFSTSSARSSGRWKRKYASPLGRSRAGAAARQARARRKRGSSEARIQASPIGVRTGIERRCAQLVEGRAACSRRDAGPGGECVGRRRGRRRADSAAPARAAPRPGRCLAAAPSRWSAASRRPIECAPGP